jgi:hypothetical protein
MSDTALPMIVSQNDGFAGGAMERAGSGGAAAANTVHGGSQ